MKKTITFVAVLLLAACSAFAQATATDKTNLVLTVANEANIAIITTSTGLSSGTTTFNDYTGTTNFKYQVRTTQSTGSGSITLKITTDFATSCTGGVPCVGTPPTAGDALTYSCTGDVGTVCSTPQTASTGSSTNVLGFGQNVHAGSPGSVANKGANGAVAWDLTNDPIYPTGSYTAVATFTISAT